MNADPRVEQNDENDGTRKLEEILRLAVEHGASDIHLKETRPPGFRIDGVLKFLNRDPLDQEAMLSMARVVLEEHEMERFLLEGDADEAHEVQQLGRFRVNCYRQRGTIAMIFRHVKSDIPDFNSLNLPEEAMGRIVSLQRGLVLVTGTTGSGKTTTLAAILDHINRSREGHIVTLENPIEFIHKDIKCSVSQRDVYLDTRDFKTGMRAVMREDPDVILIGEMRDVDTFMTCMAAAETGHLVFSTLHTTNVMMTIDRILDFFPPDQHAQVRSQLAMLLRAVLSQRLLPRASGKGRVPAVEVLFNNPGIAALIRDDDIEQLPTAIADGDEDGMQTFNMSLAGLVKRELVTEETALVAADNPDELRMNFQGIFLSRNRGGILKRPGR